MWRCFGIKFFFCCSLLATGDAFQNIWAMSCSCQRLASLTLWIHKVWAVVDSSKRLFVREGSSPVSTGGFCGLSHPPSKAPIPPNLNMKHYKSVEFLSIVRVCSLPAQTQIPSIENFLATVLERRLKRRSLIFQSKCINVSVVFRIL